MLFIIALDVTVCSLLAAVLASLCICFKKRWEWILDQQGLSWKTRLKKAIDQVVMNSEDFEDFLA